MGLSVKANPRQVEAEFPHLTRQPFIHPSRIRPGVLDARRWRLVASEPINRMARRMIQREISSLNWKIVPEDPKSEEQQKAVLWYSEVFKDFRSLANRVLKTMCELPQGGAWEVGWIKPGVYGEGARGTLAFVKYIDGATLNPTLDVARPIMQLHPFSPTEHVLFREEEIVRFIGWPNDEFGLTWWQESPTQASYLAIEALSRIYVYSLKQLRDTPVAGILDLMDFEEADAKAWAESFREILVGIDPIKIPLLYQHEQAAKWLPIGNPFGDMEIPTQFKLYADLVLSNYGLSINDLRILNHDDTKGGAGVSRKITTQQGIRFYAELIKDKVQELLPRYLIFEYTQPDLEDERTKAQTRAANARTIQTFDWLPVVDKAKQALKDGVLTIDIDPDDVEKRAQEMMEIAAGMSGIPSPTPGQLKPGEGRPRDELEDDAKATAATGSRVFTKGNLFDRARASLTETVEKATRAFMQNFPSDDQKVGEGIVKVEKQLEAVLAKQFRDAGKRLTNKIVARLLISMQTQIPDMLQDVEKEALEARAEYSKADDIRTRIDLIVEQLLSDATFYELDDEEFIELVWQILREAYEEGLLAGAEGIQQALVARGIVESPGVPIDFRVTNPNIIDILKNMAANMVRNIDNGTRYFLRQLIVNGAIQGMGVDELTDHIQAELFGLPVEEAGKLNRDRIRSIVTTELNRADTLGRLKQMEEVGLTLKRWVTRQQDVCTLCLANEARGSVKLDFLFDDVFGPTPGPPGHPVTCHCFIAADANELAKLGSQPEYFDGSSKEKADFSGIISGPTMALASGPHRAGDEHVTITPLKQSMTVPEAMEIVITELGLEEKFNPHHVPAGVPEGGQFTTTGGAGTATGKKFQQAQGKLSTQIDTLSKQYRTVYKKYYVEEDDDKAAVLWKDVEAISVVRDRLIDQRDRNKQANIDAALATIAKDKPKQAAIMRRILEERRGEKVQ